MTAIKSTGKSTGYNTGLSKVAVHCYADSFVIKENFSPHENYS
jgi:hypothetical protein